MRAPFLIILQHHDIASATMLAAPMVGASATLPYILAPRLFVQGSQYDAYLLGLTPVSRSLLLDTVASAEDQTEPITNALDIILHGDPMGRPG